MPPDLAAISRCIRAGDYKLSKHAFDRLTSRGIPTDRLEEAIGRDRPEVIEDYPNNEQGPKCLILGWVREDEPLHAVVTCVGQPIVVTVYEPDPGTWYNDFRSKRSGTRP